MIAFVFLLTLSGFGRIDKAPSSARVYLGNGQKLMQMERFKEAAEEFERALVEVPSLSEARQQLAICQFELRQYSEARQLFLKMIQLKENPVLVTYYLGRLDLLEQDLEGAVRHFRSLSGPVPFRDELYYLGVAYFKQGKFLPEPIRSLGRPKKQSRPSPRLRDSTTTTFKAQWPSLNAGRCCWRESPAKPGRNASRYSKRMMWTSLPALLVSSLQRRDCQSAREIWGKMTTFGLAVELDPMQWCGSEQDTPPAGLALPAKIATQYSGLRWLLDLATSSFHQQ